jgi:hypothetical protein
MNKTKKIIAILIIAILVVSGSGVSRVLAVEFDSGYIISDTDLTSYNSMTLAEIQSFLENRAGRLGTYLAVDCNGEMKSAAEIIYDAAQKHRVSPKFLLVMLQKEQSLVESRSPRQSQYDWAMGYAVCDDCSVTDPGVLLFKGFGVQVDKAAGVQRWYIEKTNNGWLKTPGKTYIINGQTVTIKNQATANLYNYTPHILGNYNFWKIWNNWFSQFYPDGTLLQVDGEKTYWLLQNGLRREFKSKTILTSRYDINKVVVVGKNELEKYIIGTPIKYANYSLLQAPDKTVYLLVDDLLRKFESSEVVRKIGYNPEEFEQITTDELGFFQLGGLITVETVYPSGKLLQDNKTGGVFFVQDGRKHPLITKDILKINFPNDKIKKVTTKDLEKYETFDSIKLRDGEIVKIATNPTVYVISNGTKRPVSSGTVYERLGYKWKNVKVVQEKTLSNLPLGPVINLDFKK